MKETLKTLFFAELFVMLCVGVIHLLVLYIGGVFTLDMYGIFAVLTIVVLFLAKFMNFILDRYYG